MHIQVYNLNESINEKIDKLKSTLTHGNTRHPSKFEV